jgi:hypothetical protein
LRPTTVGLHTFIHKIPKDAGLAIEYIRVTTLPIHSYLLVLLLIFNPHTTIITFPPTTTFDLIADQRVNLHSAAALRHSIGCWRQQPSTMNQELAAPVKGIINAFRRGIIQTQRICKFAQNASATHMLDVLQPAQGLERSLTNSEARIKEAYSQSMTAFGRRYSEQLANDR